LKTYLILLCLVASASSALAAGGRQGPRQCAAIAQGLTGQPIQNGIEVRRFTSESHGYEIPYAVVLPKGYTSKKKWPVLVFLHGLMESGTDLNAPINNGGLLPNVFSEPENFPAIVVIPQVSWDVPADVAHRWYSSFNPADQAAPRVSDLVIQAVDETIKNFSADAKRVSLSGVSMGAFGVWGIASQYPDRFSALLPISGEPKIEDFSQKIPDMPIWIVHGEYDDVVPVHKAREAMEQLWQSGHHQTHYTEYPQATHVQAWEWGFKHKDILDWLFRQHR
jgi:predicted peptidase